MYFGNCRLPRKWLDECLKSLVSEHHSTANMLSGPKYCWHLQDGTLIKFFCHSEGNGVAKTLSSWNIKSYDCLLIHWVQMTSILFVIVRSYGNQFKCNYLWNKKLVLNFLLYLPNLHQILDILKYKTTLIA